jgi:hypothetical protein
MSLLSDASPAAWVVAALTANAPAGTVAAIVPPVFSAYARILPPTYDREERRHRWSEIAESRGVTLTEVVPGLVEVEVAVPRLRPAWW